MWAKAKSLWRRVWHYLAVVLPNWRLLPALVALALYPVIHRLGLVPSAVIAVLLFAAGLWFGRKMLRKRGEMIAAAAFIAGLAVVALLLRVAFEDAWVDVGTFSGLAFRFALYGLLAAGIVIGAWVALAKQRTVLGVLVVGVGLGAVVGFSMFVGQIPFWAVVDGAIASPLSLDGVNALLADLIAVAVLSALLSWRYLRGERGHVSDWLNGNIVPAAAGVALVLPAVFLAAAVAGGFGLRDGRDPPQFRQGERPAVKPSALSSRELADNYAPVFLIDRRERWPVESVKAYLSDENTTVRKLEHGSDPPVGERPGPDRLPRSCGPRPELENRRPEPLCYVISAGCPDVGTNCDHGRNRPWTQDEVPAGTVYARVLRLGEKPDDGSPDVFAEPVPYEGLQTLIQYWVFYRDDLWRADTGFGRLVQLHEADWEYVMVGLGADEPLFVAYSAHCGGEVQPWEDVRTDDRGDAVHPVVWVARGSHANYPGPQPRAPDFTSCPKGSKRAKLLLSQLAFVANVREVLPDSLVQQHPAVQPVNAHYPPFSVPARWAPKDAMRIENLFHDAVIPPAKKTANPEPSGPETPTCKADWKDPLAILACSQYWGDEHLCDDRLRKRFEHIPSGCI